MNRPVAVVGAPSSIGIRPYDDDGPRRLDLTPGVLREQGLVARLGAKDWGDVLPPPYRDLTRVGTRPRNEEGVVGYSRSLAARIAEAADDGAFAVVLGGDCSIVLGSLLGVRREGRPAPGLLYVDAHADFASPEESLTGSAASMCLSLAVGRGDTPLARLGGDEPLARAADVVLLGRRDHAEPWYGHAALEASAILDIPHREVRERGPAATVDAARARLAAPGTNGFWIHIDADVIDPAEVPAVDSPEPGGLMLGELADLLRPLAHHPQALGLELTIYDPKLDPDRTSAARLATLLERIVA